MSEEKLFDSWAIVELMGHRSLAGRISEQVIGGASLLRIDVPECPSIDARPAIPEFTQFYGATAIYCITPTTEEIARRVTLQKRERPIALYDVAPRALPVLASPNGSLDFEEEVDHQ